MRVSQMKPDSDNIVLKSGTARSTSRNEKSEFHMLLKSRAAEFEHFGIVFPGPLPSNTVNDSFLCYMVVKIKIDLGHYCQMETYRRVSVLPLCFEEFFVNDHDG